MQPDQKKAKIEQVVANKALRRDTLSKDSIAMQNPAYIKTSESTDVSPSAVSTRKKKHVTPGERQALLACRNEKFRAAPNRKNSTLPEEGSKNTKVTNDIQAPKQLEVIKEGNKLNCAYNSPNQI